MKKIKLLAFMLIIPILMLTGCGGVNANIKLAETDLSTSTFFNQSINELSYVLNKGQVELNAQEDAEMSTYFGTMRSMVGEAVDIYYTLISAMDFCLEVAESATAVNETQKIYEYKNEYNSGENFVVVVSKPKGKSVYTSKMYVVNGTVNYDQLASTTPVLTNVYTIAKDKTSGMYEFTETENDASGEFLFNNKKGKLYFSIEFEITDSFGTINYVTEANLYNYKNNVLGGRILTSLTYGGKTETLVQEYLCKEYYKKSKLGTVKNTALYVDLEQTEEVSIAASNAGDGYGFEMIYDAQSDLSAPQSLIESYGIFPEL